MTGEEVINLLREIKQDSYRVDYSQAIDIAMDAVESRRLTQKPILKNRTEVVHLNKGDIPHEWKEVEFKDWVCPVCGHVIGVWYSVIPIKPYDKKRGNYCDDCGQAIDWSDVDE